MAQPAPSHINLCSKVMAAGIFLKNEFSESMTPSPSSCLVDHLRFRTGLKAPLRIRFRVISAKNRSTMLSQEAEVGVKCK